MQVQIITPQKFLSDFIKATNSIDVKDYKGNKTYTERVLDGVIKMLKDYGVEFNKEYYRIDTYGWKQQYESYPKLQIMANDNGLKFHCWSPTIAIEHENDKTDWLDELVKIAYVRCPLKVVIGYTTSHDGDDKKLQVASELLKNLAYYEEDNDKYLIILGLCEQENYLGEQSKYEYMGYLFDKIKEKFIKIEVADI